MTATEAIAIIKNTSKLRYEEMAGKTSDLGDALRMAVEVLEKMKGEEHEIN